MQARSVQARKADARPRQRGRRLGASVSRPHHAWLRAGGPPPFRSTVSCSAAVPETHQHRFPPSFVLDGPESAFQKPRNVPICTFGLEKAPRAASTGPSAVTSGFPQLKPPTIQCGRRLFSCVGWSIGPSRATLGLKHPTTTALTSGLASSAPMPISLKGDLPCPN